MLKALIFDIDGVLMDSFDANLAYFQEIFKKAGCHIPTADEYKAVFHSTYIDVIKKLTIPDETEKISLLFESGEKTSYPSNLLKKMPDSKKTLELLSRTYKLAIVSNRRKEGIERYLAFAETKNLFSAIVGSEECENPKPHPEPLLLASKKLGIEPKLCAYIGDSETDIIAGSKAKMKTILFGTVEMKKEIPDAKALNFSELIKIVTNL